LALVVSSVPALSKELFVRLPPSIFTTSLTHLASSACELAAVAVAV